MCYAFTFRRIGEGEGNRGATEAGSGASNQRGVRGVGAVPPREPAMSKTISALLVGGADDDSETLERALEKQSVRALRAGTCREARKFLSQAQPPHLLFTHPTLPDGTWADVVKLASEAPKAVDVIVVSRVDDVNLYLETMQRGAFDFISSPLPGSDFARVVRCASSDVESRRKSVPRTGHAA